MVFAARAVKKPSKKSSLLSNLAWAGPFLVLLGGCTPSPPATPRDLHQADSAYVVPWEQFEVYLKAAPSPVQVALWLREEKVGFYRDPLHDPTLAGRYSGLQGAANLGIYLTDMAYAHATKQYQPAYEYLTAVNRLASRYSLEDIFSPERIKALDALQDRPDSVQRLMAQYYGEIQERLTETGQQAMLRHMILGGWLESLHLTLQILEREPQKSSLSDVVLLQKSLVPLLLKLYAADTAHSEASRRIFGHLSALQATLETLPIQESQARPQTTVSQNRIQIEFGQKVKLTPDKIQEVRSQLLPLRNFIIQT
ncbi:MAG: hypothetical protein KatS3mg026_0461 [Bacteroidia bacterium]|nr:MAG: hypothetical protein KatS3mg026_0461 [Bacteroidia bacterium]